MAFCSYLPAIITRPPRGCALVASGVS